MALQPSTRLVFIEPSKVRHYHSTMVDGLICAYLSAGLAERYGVPVLYAHRSFFAHLSEQARAGVEYRPIRVLDHDKRRLVLQSLLEAWTVFLALVKLKRGELLFVTTIMPSALLLVEIVKKLFWFKRLVSMQHGELEGAVESDRQHLLSYGFYIINWLRLRRWFGSSIEIAVLDRFIATAVLERFEGAFNPERTYNIPQTMMASNMDALPSMRGETRICFIGNDTKNKGLSIYKKLASRFPRFDFRVVGGGTDRSLERGEVKELATNQDFLNAVWRCDIAIFPYTGGYTMSLSGAAIDAMACGLHLLATDRPCFVALAEAFGPDCVTICRDEEEMAARLTDPKWVAEKRACRAVRIEKIAKTRYGLDNVGLAIEAMLRREQFGRT